MALLVNCIKDFIDIKLDPFGFEIKSKTIHELFEEQAERTPENIALVFEGKTMTYRQLNAKANQLARKLRYKGVRKGSIVGIMVERSFEMIIGIMGIMKAGGVYLPLDPTYPKERIKYILEDSKSILMLYIHPDQQGSQKES